MKRDLWKFRRVETLGQVRFKSRLHSARNLKELIFPEKKIILIIGSRLLKCIKMNGERRNEKRL